MNINQAIEKLDTKHPVLYKRGSIHVNACFKNTQLAISGTTSICRNLALLCKRSVLVNIYYMKDGKLHQMKRWLSLYGARQNKPAHVTQTGQEENQR